MRLHPLLPRLDLARASFLVALCLVAGVVALLRPAAAVAAGPAAPAMLQEKPAAGQAEKEENGGNLVFQVVSKVQKFSVIYSHDQHLEKGIECVECHETIFKKKINGNKFKMSDINKGQYCGICHTETPGPDVKHPAFAPKKNCAKCHTVRVREPDWK